MVAKNAKIMHTEFPYNPNYDKPPHTMVEQLKSKIYNSETKEFLGTTPSSWGKIGLCYLIFYAVLIGLIAICYWVFHQTIDPRRPTWQLDRTLIGNNPGLGYRPFPPDQNVERKVDLTRLKESLGISSSSWRRYGSFWEPRVHLYLSGYEDNEDRFISAEKWNRYLTLLQGLNIENEQLLHFRDSVGHYK